MTSNTNRAKYKNQKQSSINKCSVLFERKVLLSQTDHVAISIISEIY